jgi:hypothetical protein
MNHIDAKNEIAFIKKVIEDSKRAVGGDNLGSVVWGVIVAIGMILTYLHIIALTDFIHVGLLWAILIALGWIYTVSSMIKQRKKPSTKTFGGRMLTSIWTACGIVMTCFGFYAAYLHVIEPWAIVPVCSLIIGIGYYVTADIVASRLTKIFALVWWIGGLLMMTWPGAYIFLLFASLIIALQIIPNTKYHLYGKKQRSGAAK